MFTVGQFFGINEAADGLTELGMGEASRMENFFVTDAYNLTVRPGIQRIDTQDRTEAAILASWAGHVGEQENEELDDEYLVVVDFDGTEDRIFLYRRNEDKQFRVFNSQRGALGLTAAKDAYVKIFPFGGRIYIMSAGNTVYFEGGEFRAEEAYIPLVIAGAEPGSGSGTVLENINLLSSRRRIDYSADGTATAYQLPGEAKSVLRIVIDNEEKVVSDAGSFDVAAHTFTFKTAPVKGVGNVEITYDTDAAAAEENRMRIVRMALTEAYNGSTDTRLFVAGDGSNICYYSGVTQNGEATPMYFPAMNEIAVDMTSAAVTGLIRHYSKLLVFTRGGGAYTISYEPVTNTDGSTVAGFYLRSANKGFGNDVMGQVATVNNFARTVTKDGIYSWNITASYYQDERYAKRVSDMVERSLKAADIENVVVCDDNFSKTYYVFLNDDSGTVLVNRYDLGKEGVWCIYRGELFKGVKNAMVSHGTMVFNNGTDLFYMNDGQVYDAAAQRGGERQQIKALWESGYMDFGADFQQKYSSEIYVSMLPQTHSSLFVTASTDRREEYLSKEVANNIFSWQGADFRWWTFNTNVAPKIRRVRLKVKKFVYYKLIFRVEEEGAQATVLGYDQTVRFGAKAK
jgi:hypothetical protein